jgi:hypothetical protein
MVGTNPTVLPADRTDDVHSFMSVMVLKTFILLFLHEFAARCRPASGLQPSLEQGSDRFVCHWVFKAGNYICQRLENKASFAETRVRDLKTGQADLDAAIKYYIQINYAWAISSLPEAAHLPFYCQAAAE